MCCSLRPHKSLGDYGTRGLSQGEHCHRAAGAGTGSRRSTGAFLDETAGASVTDGRQNQALSPWFSREEKRRGTADVRCEGAARGGGAAEGAARGVRPGPAVQACGVAARTTASEPRGNILALVFNTWKLTIPL